MYIFVYGTLKKGFHLHRFLEEEKFIGEAVLENHQMYSFGFCPGIVKCKDKCVHGEIYEIIHPKVMEEIYYFERSYKEGRANISINENTYECVYFYMDKKDKEFLIRKPKEVPSGIWKWS